MIFISYAKEDTAYAEKLYLALFDSKLEPWMDKPPAPHQGKGLRIGDRWRAVLEHQIKRANHIILVLSPRSVSKRGFVQREFRLALDLMNELPPDGRLVYPVVAEECTVPAIVAGSVGLHDIQWQHVPEPQLGTFAAELSEMIGQD